MPRSMNHDDDDDAGLDEGEGVHGAVVWRLEWVMSSLSDRFGGGAGELLPKVWSSDAGKVS